MKRYKYKLNQPRSFQTSIEGVHFENRWMHLHISGSLVVKKDYAWDGASPKRSFLDLFLIGTPDGVVDYRTGMPILYEATLVHDVLMQFRRAANLRLDEVNRVFYEMMREKEFKLAWLYYYSVVAYWGVRNAFERKRKAGKAIRA